MLWDNLLWEAEVTCAPFPFLYLFKRLVWMDVWMLLWWVDESCGHLVSVWLTKYNTHIIIIYTLYIAVTPAYWAWSTLHFTLLLILHYYYIIQFSLFYTIKTLDLFQSFLCFPLKNVGHSFPCFPLKNMSGHSFTYHIL